MYFDHAWHMRDLMKATLAMLEMDRKEAEKPATKPQKPKRQKSST